MYSTLIHKVIQNDPDLRRMRPISTPPVSASNQFIYSPLFFIISLWMSAGSAAFSWCSTSCSRWLCVVCTQLCRADCRPLNYSDCWGFGEYSPLAVFLSYFNSTPIAVRGRLSKWLFLMKILTYSIYNSDAATYIVLLHSVYKVPSNERDIIWLASGLTKLSYLSMLFILELGCFVCSAGQLKNEYHVQIGKNHASSMKSGSCVVDTYHEDQCRTIVEICEILMYWTIFHLTIIFDERYE